MQNHGPYRSLDNFGTEDDKFFNENFASVIDSDYVLNYLNDPEAAQRRSMNGSNLFGQVIPEIQMPFPNFQEAQKPQEQLQNIYGNLKLQEPWLFGNVSEAQKMQFVTPSVMTYKMENPEEFDGNMKVKKLKTNKETEIRRVPEIPSRMKSNIKNTYINKINSLITTEQKPSPNDNSIKASKGDIGEKIDLKKAASIKNESVFPNPPPVKMGLKKVRSCDVLKSDELEKLNMKLAKNRESARNSRIRKKVYIELLEKTVDQLQQELDSTRKQLEANNTNLSKLNFQSKPMNNLHSAKQQLFDRLEKMINTKADDSEISFLLDSLRLRFGASGKDRVEVVNYMFKQIMDFLVPVHMKYLLTVAAQGKDLFSSTENSSLNSFFSLGSQQDNTEYWEEMANQVNFTESQKKFIMKYKKKILSEKTKFEELVNDLNKVRKSVLKQAGSLQSVVDDFRNYLTPTQSAKLLLVLEKEKNRKEFSAEKLWSGISTKKENQDDVSDMSDGLFENDDEESQGDIHDNENDQKMLELIPSDDFLDQRSAN